SEARVRKLAEQWEKVRYLIVDEYSMISREFLAALSKMLNVLFKHLNKENHDLPFGGINKRSALYFPTSGQDNEQQNAGSELYRQFTTVVILKKQMRIRDLEWQGVLQRARHGKCGEADLELLRQMQIGTSVTFLVTPRNAVRKKWNSAAVRQHCKQENRQLLRCPAEDTKRGQGSLSPAERFTLLKRRFEAKLEEEILLANGMQVMLVTNIQTGFDMANGARGVVHGILLDPREPEGVSGESERLLLFPPACVLVKLDRMR
ncbi:hypothetical protein M378DRAFT_52016, partial [Amanita muscaria Koide BX008]